MSGLFDQVALRCTLFTDLTLRARRRLRPSTGCYSMPVRRLEHIPGFNIDRVAAAGDDYEVRCYTGSVGSCVLPSR